MKENERFSRNYHIDYMFIDEDLTSDFIGLASKVQETSLLHSYYSGYTMEWFLKINKGFVLTSYVFKVYKYPKWGENIKIETWPSKLRGFVANRSFKGTDDNGGRVIDVDSSWIYMDLDKKRPERVPADMADNYGGLYPALFDGRVNIPSEFDYEKVYTACVRVCRSDIDSNHHVNNISYIIWAVNAVDNGFYNGHIITDVNVRYHKESMLGENLVIELYKKDKGVIALIKAPDGELRCSVFMEFAVRSQTI